MPTSPSLPSPNTHPFQDHPTLSTRRKKIILIPQVLPTVRLPETSNTRGVEPPRLGRGPGGDAEAEGCVVHGVDNHALVLRAVLGPAAHVRLDDVAAVQEGHLAVGFHPDLVARVLGQDGQRGDVQAELARLGELAEADAEGDELVAFYFGGRRGCVSLQGPFLLSPLQHARPRSRGVLKQGRKVGLQLTN